MATGLQARRRELPRCDSTVRSVKNRIQECHQFCRSQDSSHSDTTSTPRLDDSTPGELPLTRTAEGMPPSPVAVLAAGLLMRSDRLRWDVLLPRRGRPARLAALARLGAAAYALALANPDRARPQDASQLAGLRQVDPLMRAQREVLVIAGDKSGGVLAVAATRPGLSKPGISAWARRTAAARYRKSVIRVRPSRRLLGILPGRTDSRREVG